MAGDGASKLTESIEELIAAMSKLQTLEDGDDDSQDGTGGSGDDAAAAVVAAIENVNEATSEEVAALNGGNCEMIHDKDGNLKPDTYLSSDYVTQKLEINRVQSFNERVQFLGHNAPSTGSSSGSYTASQRSTDRRTIREHQENVAKYRQSILDKESVDITSLKSEIKKTTAAEREYQLNKSKKGVTNYNMERGNYGEMMADVYMYEQNNAIAIHGTRQLGYYDKIGKGIDGIYVSTDGSKVYIADAKFGSSQLRKVENLNEGEYYQMSEHWIGKNLTKALLPKDKDAQCAEKILELIKKNEVEYLLIHINYNGYLDVRKIIQGPSPEKENTTNSIDNNKKTTPSDRICTIDKDEFMEFTAYEDATISR